MMLMSRRELAWHHYIVTGQYHVATKHILILLCSISQLNPVFLAELEFAKSLPIYFQLLRRHRICLLAVSTLPDFQIIGNVAGLGSWIQCKLRHGRKFLFHHPV